MFVDTSEFLQAMVEVEEKFFITLPNLILPWWLINDGGVMVFALLYIQLYNRW